MGSLNELEISTVNGLFQISKQEREMIVNYSKSLYKRVIKKVGINDFVGHIRMDLVPEVTNFKAIEEGYDWTLRIKGVYEVNSNSPECGAATAFLHEKKPDMAQKQPSPAKRIADCNLFNSEIKNNKIIFFIGKGPVKRSWGPYFMNSLKEKGLNLKIGEGIEDVENSDYIWRFGDVRKEAFSDFPRNFCEKLIKKQEKAFVLNTICEDYNDFGNKKFLLSSNERVLKSDEDIRWAVEKRDLVLKPFRGTSGQGIIFGSKVSDEKWREALEEKRGKGYGLFESKWLPKLDIDEVESGIVVDIAPSFFAKGDEIEYLYSIARVMPHDLYQEKGVINVSEGGGFAGTLID